MKCCAFCAKSLKTTQTNEYAEPRMGCRCTAPRPIRVLGPAAAATRVLNEDFSHGQQAAQCFPRFFAYLCTAGAAHLKSFGKKWMQLLHLLRIVNMVKAVPDPGRISLHLLASLEDAPASRSTRVTTKRRTSQRNWTATYLVAVCAALGRTG